MYALSLHDALPICHDGTEPERADPRQLDALLDQVAPDGLDATLAQPHVVLVGARGIRVPLEVDREPRVRLELLGQRRQRGLRGVVQVPAIEAEAQLER